jgi:hypothetical protein
MTAKTATCSVEGSRPFERISILPDLDEVLERLASEPTFAAALASEPTAALAGYDLSADDLAVIADCLDGSRRPRRGSTDPPVRPSALIRLLASPADPPHDEVT